MTDRTSRHSNTSTRSNRSHRSRSRSVTSLSSSDSVITDGDSETAIRRHSKGINKRIATQTNNWLKSEMCRLIDTAKDRKKFVVDSAQRAQTLWPDSGRQSKNTSQARIDFQKTVSSEVHIDQANQPYRKRKCTYANLQVQSGSRSYAVANIEIIPQKEQCCRNEEIAITLKKSLESQKTFFVDYTEDLAKEKNIKFEESLPEKNKKNPRRVKKRYKGKLDYKP